MSEELIESVQSVIKPKKPGAKQFGEILNTLKHAESLFSPRKNIVEQRNDQFSRIQTNNKKLDLRPLDKHQRILEIIKRFIDEFQAQSLPNAASVKNYVLFLVTILKVSRKIKAGHDRSLILAHTLSRLNQMLVKYPVRYSKRSVIDPLMLLFLVSELAAEADRGLEIPYKFDEVTMSQFTTLVTKFCQDFENPLVAITGTISDMPKFRLAIEIGEAHQKIIGKIIQHCVHLIPLKNRIYTASKLLNKIVLEQNDSSVLIHYNALKLFVENDSELQSNVSKLAKNEIDKTKHRRFVNGILEEFAGSGNVS